MDKFDQKIINEVYSELCQSCQLRYWEACQGVHVEWSCILCKKANELYYSKTKGES